MKIWIGNSGASCHYCNSKEGLYNYTTISEEIKVGNGNKMLEKKDESSRCTVTVKCCRRISKRKMCTKLLGESVGLSKGLKSGFNLGN
jgi:hypothetical protein